MRTQSSTLYQQIKAIAEVDEHRLVMYRNDLYQVDRTMLKTVKLGDEWIWILRECGTNIMHRPLSCAAELLREGTSEYDSKITNLLQQNADWLSAVIHEQVDSRINKARIFHLAIVRTVFYKKLWKGRQKATPPFKVQIYQKLTPEG
jgi:hypothetical protein